MSRSWPSSSSTPAGRVEFDPRGLRRREAIPHRQLPPIAIGIIIGYRRGARVAIAIRERQVGDLNGVIEIVVGWMLAGAVLGVLAAKMNRSQVARTATA